MKKCFALLLLLVAVQYTQAQYVGLTLGAALPSGSFANKSLDRPESGFANQGYTFGIQANYLLNKNLGICADLNQGAMSFDAGAYSAELQKQDLTIHKDVDVTDRYHTTSALLGATGVLPLKKFSFHLRFMAGFVNMSAPEKRIVQQLGGQEYTTITEGRSATAAAFAWGFGVNYQMNRFLYVNLRVDEVYANTKFDFDYRSSADNKTAIPMDVYNISLGLGVKIQDL